MTKHWRYEFALPLHLDTTRKMLWGTHMWIPVNTLLGVLACAYARLPEPQYSDFCRRLANADKHHDTLTEMAPVLHMDRRIPARFEQMDQPLEGSSAPNPDHETPHLFRSVEAKFLHVDPSIRLQGAWISSEIKQEQSELDAAFAALDPLKVHFAIFGTFEPDVHVLARTPEDHAYLLQTLGLTGSDRFTYRRGAETGARK